MLHPWFLANYSTLNWTDDTFKVALLNPGYIPNSSYEDFSDLTNELSESNYPAGGYTLQGNLSVSGDVYSYLTQNVTCTGLTSVIQYAVIYKTSNSKLIATFDFGKSYALARSTLKLIWSDYAFSSVQVFRPLVKVLRPKASPANTPRWMDAAYKPSTLANLFLDSIDDYIDLPEYNLLDPDLSKINFYFAVPKTKPEQSITIVKTTGLQGTIPKKTNSFNNLWDDLTFNYGEDESKYFIAPSLIFTWHLAQPNASGIIDFNTINDTPLVDTPIYVTTSDAPPTRIDYSSLQFNNNTLDIGFSEQVIVGFYSTNLYTLAQSKNLLAQVGNEQIPIQLVTINNSWDNLGTTIGLQRLTGESNLAYTKRMFGLVSFSNVNNKIAGALGQFNWQWQDATSAFTTGSMWLEVYGHNNYYFPSEIPYKVGNVLYVKKPINGKPKVFYKSTPLDPSAYTYTVSSITLLNYASGQPSDYRVNYEARFFELTDTSVGSSWPPFRIILGQKAVKNINHTKKLPNPHWDQKTATYNRSSTYI